MTNERLGQVSWTLVAATLLVPATFLSLVLGDPPKLWAPYPLPLFAGAAVMGRWVFLTPACLFLLWSIQLFRGDPRVPYRSLGALVVAGALDLWWLHQFWSNGVTMHGNRYMVAVVLVNALFIAALTAISIRSFRHPTFAQSLSLHSLLFLWLVWCAFPMLGEGP